MGCARNRVKEGVETGGLVVKGNGSGKANRQVPFLLGQSDLLHHKLIVIIALSRTED